MGKLARLASEFSIGETFAANLRHEQSEAVGIVQRVVFGGAVVVAKDLFGYIGIKMKRFDRYVGTVQTALQQRPKVLDAVGMDMLPNVAFNVVDDFMVVVVSSFV